MRVFSSAETALLWLGGTLYLLNKVFFAFGEYAKSRDWKQGARRWRIAAWVSYLLGLPPWLAVFVWWHTWIAFGVEAGGAASMVLGLVVAIRQNSGTTDAQAGSGANNDKAAVPRWLNWLALVFILVGFSLSLYDFGGLGTLTQWLETGMVVGYLVGTYLLAWERRGGYLWFMVMHVFAAWLLGAKGYPWLIVQQAASLASVAYAYYAARKPVKPEEEEA